MSLVYRPEGTERLGTDCPICGQLVFCDRNGSGYRFKCCGGHSDDEVAELLDRQVLLELVRAEYRNGSRPRQEDDDDGRPGWLVGSPMDPCAVPFDPLPTLAGFPFMHAAMAAVIAGPTGRGRSSLIEACAYDAARKGLQVAYLGSEVTDQEFNARAALLAEKRGDDPEDVREDLARVRYLDLRDTLERAWKKPKQWVEGAGRFYDVVIIDPVGDALETLRLEDTNEDYRRFYGRLIEPLRKHTAAVVMLDNVGHSDDARERPLGPSSKMHKADLMFSCEAQDEPPALQMTLRKRRTIRSSLRVGASWECDEATQRVVPRTVASLTARKPVVSVVDSMKAAIPGVLPVKTKTAAAARLDKRDDDPTFRHAWALLESDKTIAREDGEWKVVVVPIPRGGPPPQLLAEDQNANEEEEQ
jgi:hypothetical protein